MRRTLSSLYPARATGPPLIGFLVCAYAGLWVLARPAEVPMRTYAGQFLGAESILLLSIALVLISTLPSVEEYFDGIDRAAIWHRRVAIAGLVLLAPHIFLSSSPARTTFGGPLGAIGAIGLVGLVAWAVLPRWQFVVPAPLREIVRGSLELPVVRTARRRFGGYELWRTVHRTTGLFVAAGFFHGVLDGTPFHHSALLRWTYVAIGAVGLAFYVYRELLARFFLSLHDYEVDAVRAIGDDLVEIALRPRGRGMEFVPGQFAMVYLEAKDGWHRHPFTISSSPHEDVLRVSVKALGDYTSRLQDVIEPGMPAVIGGPHGRFNYAKGGHRQVWIAGGVGVAPFLSWLRALDGRFPYEVDFFYSAVGAPPFADEIGGIVDRHASLRAHFVDTRTDGRLTAEHVLRTVARNPRELAVFMCGPQTMLRTFQAELRRAGVRPGHIHREHFDWR